MSEPTTRTIAVDYLARVEGEGAMKVVVRDGAIQDVEFRIFEPPRYFEAFLRGRRFSEAPDITARICGICPVAYQMSSVHAMERAFGVRVDGQLRALRRLLYCGEWIESHVLHVFMLHAPDFLGYESAIHMARDHRDLVEMALRLKKIGNEIMIVLGGREIHPINVKVGGFYRVPERRELDALVDELQWALEASKDAVRVTAGLDFPDLEIPFEFVSVHHPDEYPFNEGRIVSNRGLDIDVSEWNDHFVEEHVQRSNALHARIRERGNYHVGPLARFALNRELLHSEAMVMAAEVGLGDSVTNPFKSIVVRAVETVHAVAEALDIIDSYVRPEEPAVPIVPVAGTGHGATEAPRGLLYHRYEIDDDERIADAQIVPPTAQNQLTIEQDLRAVLEDHIALDDAALQWRLEQTIRNYDPCISCATHFLKLDVDRG
ncbi:MAG TPA: Ni/Fe hydrogenase subunit alpha [Acidimicrobiia bacterium]|nr:Ni/Fe hydrogenase subunit alpha [Acidimicrobiia bacterium]